MDLFDSLEKEMAFLEAFDADRFICDPRNYLQSVGLPDPKLLINGSEMSFSEIVSSANHQARVAVARTLLRRIKAGFSRMDGGEPVPEPRGIPYALPLLNLAVYTNAVVWEVALAYEFANVSEHVNLDGYHSNIAGDASRRAVVHLEDTYRTSDLCHELNEQGYSIARQGALLKSMIISQTDLLSSKSESLKFSHNGLDFSINYSLDHGVIKVRDSKLETAA